MAFARKLTKNETDFCTSLGGIVIAWNHLEATMRKLLVRATRIGEGQSRVTVLIANINNMAIAEAMTAIADDHPEPRRGHLKRCAAVFDAERIYRNYYIHNPLTLHTIGADTKGSAHHITAKGGALKSHHGKITKAELDAFHDRLFVFQKYVIALLRHSEGKLEIPLASLETPPLPDKLELHRQRLIEPPPPPQSSEA